MSLRRTLVSLQIALVAVGLVVFGATSYQLYRQSELQQLRGQLKNTDLPAFEHALCDQEESSCQQIFGLDPDPDAGDGSGGLPGGVGSDAASGTSATTPCPAVTNRIPGNNLTPGSFAELRSSTGQVLTRLYIRFSALGATTAVCPAPALPARLPYRNRTFTVNAVGGPGPFLVEATSTSLPMVPGADPSATASSVADGPVIVVGIPLNDLQASLHRLLTLDIVVGSILLVALAGGSLLLIRRSLRPLERMATTSRAISAGDLSLRITATDGRSEVGQLGAALNGMLTRIERAFSERDSTEQRLRQFLADASHELRTPLTSIRGYAELWRLNGRNGASVATTSGPRPRDVAPSAGMSPRPELDADTAMARIEEHARRMGEMIEELLLLARLDESHPTQNLPVDLVVLAAEACDDAMALDPGRPVSLDADEDIIVIGELAHLRRAVANLLINAIRHTPAGTRIEVHVRSGDGVAQIVVRDHGPGMPDAGLAHAFDRFWQADASRATGGSGLGLAIVAGVAAEHGGAATVSNAPDGGAILTLRLPLPLPTPR